MPSLTFDKCCICIELKTGCFIIGYLNLIGNTIAIIFNGLYLILNIFSSHSRYEGSITIIILLYLLFLFFYLPFVTFLLVGLLQNKAAHVLAYLLYGTIFTFVSTIYAISQAIITNLDDYYSTDSKFIIKYVLEIFSVLLNIYFLLVIRSYYYRMKDPVRGPAAVYNTA